MDEQHVAVAERQIRLEYAVWPQLALTLPQARRLWHLSAPVCESALSGLVRAGYLEDRNGRFIRRGVEHERRSPPRAVPGMEATT